VLVLAPYETDADSGTAIMEVADFIDAVGDPGSDEAFAGWVANSVVGGGTATPPGGTRPEDVVRDVKRHLADADSPLDIEHAVCDQLTMGGRYAFAWIGEYDRGERQVVPWVTGAADGDWPTNRTFPVGTGAETMIDRALRTREVQFTDRVDSERDRVPWGEHAVERGVDAVAVAPLVEDGELHGVLGVYGAGEFSEMERSAIEEVADGVSSVLHDMALRGRVSQQERRLERYERLVETVGDGMYALDRDGHFMTVNNGLVEMTGYAREGLLGEHVSLLLDDEGDLEAAQRVVEGMVDEGVDELRTVETTIRRKDGSTFPAETKVALLTDDDDEFRGTVGVIRDVTERVERERELRRQNERLEAFAGIVSHDLRNPLGVAQGYLDLASETGDTDQLDRAVDALDRMEEIIDDVLALAREGKTVSETEPVDVGDLAEDAWATVETDGARLVVESTATVPADRSRLQRAFENLFRNSVEHGSTGSRTKSGDSVEHGSTSSRPEADDSVEHVSTSPRSQARDDSVEHGAPGAEPDLTVRVGVAGDPPRLYVADDGVGIPEEIRENLFEEQFSTSDDGLGLGLWVVREVASAHGWSVSATESEEGGARFEFEGIREA
jgi:PAS domain S-box-containing protein